MPAKAKYLLFFLLGSLSTAAALAVLSANYSDYRRRAEISIETARLRPLQERIAAELEARGQTSAAADGIRRSYPAVAAVSRDGWLLLHTPRYGQSVLLVPQRENGRIVWRAHFNDTDAAANGKFLCI
ncbi:Uncharacterised protein [Kingella potus]|uniref:Uncharacterized protein n=1 Tax=Kingella potus TaxID=265175 RepID=A0A377QYV4_9NEIS|nr:hypothetical protein [Kingella potus]UOP00908.1 hypothetical protein LVJ84_00305 [Kingella potus]STR00564.1 Uncharacterised protein [Kingella potus]